MNQLAVTLMIIFFPGIVAAIVCDKIAVHSKWNPFKFVLYSFLLGTLSYGSLQTAYIIIDFFSAIRIERIFFEKLTILNNFEKTDFIINISEIFWATLLAVPVAFFASAIINHKVMNRVARICKVGVKYGDENLYSYYLNSKEIDWLYIRDFDEKKIYQGRLKSYSENEKVQELVLYEVSVFDEISNLLYEVPTIYLSKEAGKFIIEQIPNAMLKEVTDGKKNLTTN